MEISSFLGGLHIPAMGALIPSNALLQADNIEYDPAGFVRGRRGRTLYGTLPNKVISLWRHYPKTGNAAFLAAYDTGSAVEIRHDTASGGTFSAATGGTGFATGKRFTFTNWASKDRSFFANGAGLWSYNGVITAVTQTGTQMTGPYIVVHQGRLFGTVFNEINYSVYATDVNDDTTVTGGSQINVSDPQGGSITGLASLPDRLLVLKNTSLWVMLGDIRFSTILTKFSEVGCVAPWTMQPSDYGVFFLGRDGLYLTDGINPKPLYLSAAIETLFTSPSANTVYPNAVGVWYPRKEVYKLKLDPGHSYTYWLHRVQVPGARAIWAWSRTTSEPLVTGAVWDSEGDAGDCFVSDASGNVYRTDSGTTDAGAAFTPLGQTAFLRLSDRQRTGRVHYVHLNYQGTNPCTVGLRYNNKASDDVSFSMGAAQALGLQRVRQMVHDQTKSGQFVSAIVTLPQDAYTAELYSLNLDVRLFSARVWR